MDSRRHPHAPTLAAIWAAVSTGEQADDERHSIPTQIADSRDIAGRYGWHIADTIVVPGHSRDYLTVAECASDMRAKGIDAFDRMLAHWAARDIHILICRDADRFARRLSMAAEFVDRCYLSGIKIYSLADGLQELHRQAINWIASAGLRAQSNVMFLVEQKKKASAKKALKGIQHHGVAPISHRYVRDHLGKIIRPELVPELRPLWDDLAVLLLEGVGWRELEDQLYRRFGHVRGDGKPYGPLRMHTLLMNPYFWGNLQMNGRSSIRKKQLNQRGKWAEVGMWIVEPGHPIPEGVTVHYGTHEPVYSGRQADAIKAELRRRFNHIKGPISARSHGWYLGLFACAECGFKLSSHILRDQRVRKGTGQRADIFRARYLKCFTRWDPFRRAQAVCTQSAAIREENARAFVDSVLRHLHASGLFSLVDGAPDDTYAQASASVARLRDELTRIEREIARLITLQIDAGELAVPHYQAQIRAKLEREQAVRSEIASMDILLTAPESPAVQRRAALETLRQQPVDLFWQLPEYRQNQILHALLQGRVIVVRDGVCIGFGDLPPDGRRRAK